jgi:excisionase family DNA binding protein
MSATRKPRKPYPTIPQASIPESRLLNVRAAAAYLSATVWFVRTLAWSRAVPYVVFGNRILFDKQDLDKFIENKKKENN